MRGLYHRVVVSIGVLLAGLAASAQTTPPKAPIQPTDVQKLIISPPATIRDLDAKQVRGVPTRMAWSPDAAWLYLRISTFDRWSNETVRHVLVETQGKRVEPLADEPSWLPRYWNVKSALTSPVLAAWKIKIDSRDELVRTTNVPREGNIGQHGDPQATPDETAQKAALASQKTRFETYLLNGRVIGSAINGHVAPGRTYAWAPAPLALIAFVSDKNKLMLMNSQGRTREVKGPKKPMLPAWSEDGRRLAFVQQTGSGTCVVKVVDIR